MDVEASLISKGLEFETFKTWIVNLFPNPDELDGVAIAHPTVDQHVVPEFFRHVGERDEVIIVAGEDRNGRSLDFDAGAFGFTHGCELVGVAVVLIQSNSTVLDSRVKTGLLLLIRGKSRDVAAIGAFDEVGSTIFHQGLASKMGVSMKLCSMCCSIMVGAMVRLFGCSVVLWSGFFYCIIDSFSRTTYGVYRLI